MAERITNTDERLDVPNEPIIPFIEGDGVGPDIWAAARRVFDAAVEKAYGGARRVSWVEVLAGQKAFDRTGQWLPDETIETFRTHLVGIKGPLTTPVGGGIRSLNVALRQILDLYVCLRPVRWYPGVPSPVKHPELVDMVIFRENTEDVYAGKELEEGTEGAGSSSLSSTTRTGGTFAPTAASASSRSPYPARNAWSRRRSITRLPTTANP